MGGNGYLDDLTYARALSEPLRLRQRNRDFETPFLVDLLLERRGTLPSEGGIVHTTVDLSFNRWIDRVIARQLHALADKNVSAAATMWRLRFVIVPYYSLRFGFRPVRTKSLAGQSPLPKMVFDRSPQNCGCICDRTSSLRAKTRFSLPRVARFA